MVKTIIDEGIKQPEKYAGTVPLTKEFCDTAIQYVLKKIDESLDLFTDKFPAPASQNLVYPTIENIEWTTAFWTGMLWLAYEVTGDEKYRTVAERNLDSFAARIDKKQHVDHHDLGFLYTLSGVSAYKLTGNEKAKKAALQAADHLITRYFEKAGIIQAWGDLSNPEQRGRMIVDCLMNLPLLYWATQVTGDRKYHDIAKIHAQQTVRHIVREDASTFHTFYMDVETGAPKYGKTQQGYSDDSSWARGQAWAIYGFPLSYRYLKEWDLIELAQKVANYFLNRLPEDSIAYWDLIFTEGDEERDSSSASIAACGLLELAKYLPLTNPYRQTYEQAAVAMVRSLADSYTTVEHPESNGILMHAVYSKRRNRGVDECCIWGDYYYFEALVRLR
ncbi:MAG: glucuronyl hydrolase, partial [bacterium]|nr:glucuronyl hydrolase [bacterium]